MIEAVCVLLCLSFPQGGGEVRVVGVDENGWPVYEAVDPNAESADEEAPATPPAKPAAESEPAKRPEPEAARAPAQALESPLHDVFRRIGHPADLEDLQGIVAWYQLTVRDHRGGELAVREITHEADARFPDRDRLLLPGRKIYGRDGQAVYAELHGLAMPSYESEAADELDLFGLLLRAPWVFADSSRFRVLEHRYEQVEGQRILRIDVERIGAADPHARDPNEAAKVDRFSLRCDPHSLDPVEIRYTLAATGVTRRMRLSKYERIGSVRIPMARDILDEAGKPSLEWRILRIDRGQRFQRSQFRPVSR